MTVEYSRRLENGQGITIFVKILWLWKGSLYKLVWVDLVVYLLIYYVINFIYRFALNFDQKKTFVKTVQFADEVKHNIPFFFLLGFFVSGVIARWIRMYLLIPYLNKPAFLFEGYINGKEPATARRLRRTILRYLNLAWILLMRDISDQIGTRFRHNGIEKEGSNEEICVRDIFMNFNRDKKIQSTYRKIITDSEIRAFENIAITYYSKNKSKYIPEYWVPIQWASRILQKSFIHEYVSDPRTVNKMIEELERVRFQMQKLQIVCGIMIPLVYTQVVIIAVYSYFICELFSSQLIDASHNIKGHELDFYVPIFTIFQFLFLMGWLKVAMCVMNPFGDDDEDFQTSEILDYNLDVTSRSISGELDMFPEKMETPKMKYECRYVYTPDTLETFLDEIDYDLEDIDRNTGTNEVVALEMKKGVWAKFCSCIKCKSLRKTNDRKDILMMDTTLKHSSLTSFEEGRRPSVSESRTLK